MSKFDLHMHSKYSNDGQYSPKELMELVRLAKLDTIALTDHDSVQGVKEMMEEAKQYQIKVIPAIECSTLFKDYPVHVLGYGIDINDMYFQTLTKKVRTLVDEAFILRTNKIIKKYSLDIDIEKFMEENKGTNLWSRFCITIFNDPKNKHIEDFKNYRKGGKRSDPASVNFSVDKLQPGSDLYVRVEFPDFKETVDHIHKAGGIAILAHPFRNFYQSEQMLAQAIEWGIDGIEAYSNYHETIHNCYYEKYAKDHDLLITCGSDFHGDLKPSIRLGEYGLHDDGTCYLEKLLEKINQR